MLAKPADAQNFVVDVSSAEFLQQEGSVQQRPSGQQAGLCPGPGHPIDPVVANDLTCCCDIATELVTYTSHLLTCRAPSACNGKCVTNVKSCNVSYNEPIAAPKSPSGPAKPADIKVSVVNGEKEPLLVTLRDADSNAVIADRTLWNDAPFAVTLNNKGGKGHLKWAVSTIPAGLSTAFLNFIPWDGASQYAVGANVVLGGDYYRAIKASQHVTPPNAEYWQPVSVPGPKPGAKSKCGEGDADNLTTGAKVILKASHSC
jgi:hypothetical protein